MAKCDIFTASHIETVNRIEHGMKPMLESLTKWKDSFTTHFISLSYEEDMKVEIESLKQFVLKYPWVCLDVHDTPKRQFEHFQYLMTKTLDCDSIMLLDDDDLVIQFPCIQPNICYLGNQWILESSDFSNIKSIDEKISMCSKHSVDLSGFTIPMVILKTYFESVRTTKDQHVTEDCTFMQYIESNYPAVLINPPFILRQVNVVPNIHKTWVKRNRKELDDLNTILMNIKKDIQNLSDQYDDLIKRRK